MPSDHAEGPLASIRIGNTTTKSSSLSTTRAWTAAAATASMQRCGLPPQCGGGLEMMASLMQWRPWSDASLNVAAGSIWWKQQCIYTVSVTPWIRISCHFLSNVKFVTNHLCSHQSQPWCNGQWVCPWSSMSSDALLIFTIELPKVSKIYCGKTACSIYSFVKVWLNLDQNCCRCSSSSIIWKHCQLCSSFSIGGKQF